MKKHKLIGLLLAAAMLLVSVTGCSSSPSGTSSGSSDGESGGTVKDTLTIALHSEPPSLSTVDNDDLVPIYMNLLTGNLLFKIDPETLLVEPDLVESYEQTSDTEYIFKLHEGVKFHHGKELDAEDVVASIENAKKYPASSPYTGEIASVEAIDKYQVKMTLVEPYSNLLYDLAYHFNYILPKDLLESGHDFASEPVGTGPYKFVEWNRGNSITFEKNDEYWDESEMPTIKTIIWKLIPEGTSRTLALETGEVDVIYQVETADVERLKADSRFHVEEKTSVEHYYMPINTAVAPFDDVNLRQAISHAIDREAVIVGALNGYGTPAYSSVPMGYEGSWEGDYVASYDLDKAKEYLAAWGGDPSTVEFPILCKSDENVRVATIVQDNLSKIGINATIEQIDNASWHSRRASGDYITGITSWSPSNCFTYLVRYDSSKAESIPGALVDEETDALIAQMKATSDTEARVEIMHQIVDRVNQLVPHIPMWQGQYFRAWNADLEGIVISGTGYVQFHTAKWKGAE